MKTLISLIVLVLSSISLAQEMPFYLSDYSSIEDYWQKNPATPLSERTSYAKWKKSFCDPRIGEMAGQDNIYDAIYTQNELKDFCREASRAETKLFLGGVKYCQRLLSLCDDPSNYRVSTLMWPAERKKRKQLKRYCIGSRKAAKRKYLDLQCLQDKLFNKAIPEEASQCKTPECFEMVMNPKACHYKPAVRFCVGRAGTFSGEEHNNVVSECLAKFDGFKVSDTDLMFCRYRNGAKGSGEYISNMDLRAQKRISCLVSRRVINNSGECDFKLRSNGSEDALDSK